MPFSSKVGGILLLILIFAFFTALGSLAGGATAIGRVIVDVKNAEKRLQENRQIMLL